jgi:hypothetical protein
VPVLLIGKCSVLYFVVFRRTRTHKERRKNKQNETEKKRKHRKTGEKGIRNK